jgi:DNA processing protein
MTAAWNPPGALSDAERLAWLRLIRSEAVGPATFRDLLTHFGNVDAALDAVPDLARNGGKQIRLASIDEVERELAAAEKAGVRFVAIREPEYPAWLRAIDSAPPLIAVRGNAQCLLRPTIAVVGSRNASIAGRKFAMQIAGGLGEAGFSVASGLARGIDAAAHTATPVEIDEIIRFTALRPATVRLVLLELNLAGRIEYHGGGKVSLI